MWTIFKRDVIKNWLMILGWGIGLGLLGYFLFDIYEAMLIRDVDLMQLIDAFPEGMMAFFGSDGADIFEPAGFIHLEFYSYIHIILGIMVIGQATGLIAKKEEDGTIEVLISQPISRSALFWSRLLAQVISLVLILAIIWAGFAIGLANAEVFDLEQSRLVLPLISLLAVLLLFLGLALFLSQVLPSGSAAGLVSGFVLIASFFITSLAQIDDRLETLNRFSPLRFYQGGRALTGLDLEHLVILLGISALLIGLAWLLFAKRDLRFGGTGWLRLVITKRADKGKVDSPDRRQLLAHIHELMQEKDYPAAKKSAEVFVSQFPDQPEGWLLLAGVSEPAESLRFVRKARELAPADPRVDEAEAWAMERMDLESETKPVQVAESQQAQESNRNR